MTIELIGFDEHYAALGQAFMNQHHTVIQWNAEGADGFPNPSVYPRLKSRIKHLESLRHSV
jgi:hypothetical protein